MIKVITKELIDLSVDGNEPNEVIKNMAKLIDATGRISDFEGYYQSVLEREELTSTGIGFGIAIPHGKSEHVKECTIAFGRLKEPINWQSLDDTPVEMVFLLAVPKECAGDEHLKIIASLSRRLIHEDFRGLLKTTQNANVIVREITESLAGAIAC
ncbi:MAG: fructose PTS transporter subunit IIA [Streptococcaceae bacterium]|jgi:fructose-specific phosphotransferase system IIA component|nr:fructose PTS transporter subunit IIA [Streptococcaceae bacterium]